MTTTYLPQNLTLSTGTLVEGFEDVTDWTAVLSTLADDTSYYKTGTQGVKFTSNAGPVNSKMTKTITSTQFAATDIIQLDVYSATHWSSPFYLYLSNSSGLSTTNLASLPFYVYEGSTRIRLLASDFTTTSGGDWADPMLSMRLQCGAINGETPVVYFDNLRVNPDSYPALLLTFDGGYVEQYAEVFPYLQTLGVKATMYVIGNRVDTAGYCTTAQLQEMYAAGWDIANHTWDHVQLASEANADDVEGHITPCTDLLVAADMPRAAYHLAYPGGSHNHTFVFDGLAQAGMLSGRTITGTAGRQSLPARMWYDLGGQAILTATTWSTIEAYLDAILAKKEVFSLFMHKVTASPTPTEDVDLLIFQQIIAYCIANDIPILTISELYGLESAPLSYAVGSNVVGTSFSELKEAVNDATKNWPYAQSTTAEADGAQTVFVLPDHNIVPLSDVVTTTTGGGLLRDYDYTINNDTGTVTFATAPADGDTVTVTYQQKRFSDEEVGRAINAGIDSLFPELYVYGVDTSLTESTVQDYALPSDVESVVEVESQRSSQWYLRRDWTTTDRPTAKYLHFHKYGGSYPLRIHYVARAANLSAETDTLETTAGLPSRAANPIVAYAVWQLLKETESQRVWDDRSHNTTGSNVLRAYEISNVASSHQLNYQFQLQKNRMKPWSRR